MDVCLTPEELRVLGCLLEKKMATPEYYPLSLNALLNACNQKANRTPVVTYDEPIVLQTLEGLRGSQGSQGVRSGSGGQGLILAIVRL